LNDELQDLLLMKVMVIEGTPLRMVGLWLKTLVMMSEDMIIWGFYSESLWERREILIL